MKLAYPVKHPSMVHFIEKIQRSLWMVQDVDLSRDAVVFPTLSNDVQNFIKNILAFFAAADVIVNDNIERNFKQKFADDFHIQMFYHYQASQECVHTQTYTALILNFVPDENERLVLLNSVETNPFVKKKAEWTWKYMNDPDCPLQTLLVAMACVEGIFFSASFCSIYWIKHQGKRMDLPGFCLSNEYIARDEALHTEFACQLFQLFGSESTNVSEIVTAAVNLECDFVNSILQVNLVGMNATNMCNYVRFCADRLLSDLGHAPIFNVANPFDWMNLISVDSKPDFFAKNSTNYKIQPNANIKRIHTLSPDDLDF